MVSYIERKIYNIEAIFFSLSEKLMTRSFDIATFTERTLKMTENVKN